MTTININQTKLKQNGRLMNFYHVTPADAFEHYYPLSHFGTAKAANMRGLYYLCLANNSINLSGASSVDEMYEILSAMPDAPSLSMKKVHLYMKNPIEVEDWGDHGGIAGWKNWFVHDYEPKSKYLNASEFAEQCYASEQHQRYGVSLKTRYKKCLAQFIFEEPLKSLTPEELKQELTAENLFQPKNEQVDREHVALQRMIRFLEGEGYDGFRYVNANEDQGSISYIIFRPWQVFNALVPEAKHTRPVLTEQQSAFLLAQERKFFHSVPDRGLSPSERIQQYMAQKVRLSKKALNR